VQNSKTQTERRIWDFVRRQPSDEASLPFHSSSSFPFPALSPFPLSLPTVEIGEKEGKKGKGRSPVPSFLPSLLFPPYAAAKRYANPARESGSAKD